jgi:hypothetical protein
MLSRGILGLSSRQGILKATAIKPLLGIIQTVAQYSKKNDSFFANNIPEDKKTLECKEAGNKDEHFRRGKYFKMQRKIVHRD